MYDPHGRYRYSHGIVREMVQNVIGNSMTHSNQNWRAVVALVVSVPLNIPGLIASINPLIDVGRIKHVYDFAWLFGVRSHVTRISNGDALISFSSRRRRLCTTRRPFVTLRKRRLWRALSRKTFRKTRL